MGKLSYLLVILLVALTFIGLTSAALIINEIEVNPPGSEAGNEWIELFNDGTPVNLSGWYIQDKDGNNYSFGEVIVTQFYVLDGLSGLENLNQDLNLYDKNGAMKDSYENFDDILNSDMTWSRMPDGTGNFDFKTSTKGLPNEEIEINDRDSTPSCITASTNVTLSASVTGFCVTNVVFSVLVDGSWINFNGIKNGDEYSARIPSILLNASESVDWTMSATDCFNTTMQDGIESFYVNSKTMLEIDPTNPSGLGGWYVTEPFFELINPDAAMLFYQWDSQQSNEYTAPFGLEDVPNNANVTGGILELNYWSDVCNEERHRVLLKTDFKDPEIEDLQPAQGSVVINNPRPTISALLDEVYQSNSGINKSEVEMYLDGVKVNAGVETSGSILDAEISFTPLSDLSEGNHSVRIDAKDNAGRSSSMGWNFTLTLSVAIEFEVNSPINKIYKSKKVPFNISASEVLDTIEYINYNENTPRWRLLCHSCMEYGSMRKKERSLVEGENNITIRGISIYGQVIERNVTLMIESRSPKISKTLPQRGFTSGNFTIVFEEENPVNVTLVYGNSFSGMRTAEVDYSQCETERDFECSILVDLIDYQEAEIEYYFIVSDIANNTAISRSRELIVDAVPPAINEFGYNITDRKVDFMFNITEMNLKKVYYTDHNEANPRGRTLCTRLVDELCKKKVTFSSGEHNLTLTVEDKAGNKENIENIVFVV